VKLETSATPLTEWITERIRSEGPLHFAEFMRECLYHPQWGYYSRPENRRFADYYTSVDVHPIFGRLLARQLEEMWRLLDCPAQFWAVEAGAGTGRLASHVLDFIAREFPELYGAMRYVAVEGSPRRRSQQSELLAGHLDRGHAMSAEELPTVISAGCIFSNELLDALPVHRVTLKGGKLQEIYVTLGSGALVEELGPLSTPEISAYFQRQAIGLREGQQAEAGLAVCLWIEEAGKRLGRGFVLTVDYGHEAQELYNERHMRGTVLAYADHRVNENFLHAPGEQDLTAHVNFTALDLWGRPQGLERTGSASQMAFLVALGRANEFGDLYEPGATEVERTLARQRLKTLIHPEGLGETFRVFVQHKGIAAPWLTGLAGV
jgi:SAM-dependent MidA family methyltransferase